MPYYGCDGASSAKICMLNRVMIGPYMHEYSTDMNTRTGK